MRKLPGINIQWPWSELIISGTKSVETRNYVLPAKYVGKQLALIETPGKAKGRPLSASIRALVTFGEPFQYLTAQEWLSDFERHRVPDNDLKFVFSPDVKKYGWPVEQVELLKRASKPPYPRGIVFASSCRIFD
jgi:hypothetical protein